MSGIKKCYSCGAEMQFTGEAPFRVGGTSGGWKLLFGELAELRTNAATLYLHMPAMWKS